MELSYISGNGKPKKLVNTYPEKFIFQEIELSCSKKLNTLNKTPLGETGCLSNLYYLLVAQASNFLIHSPFPNTLSWTTSNY